MLAFVGVTAGMLAGARALLMKPSAVVNELSCAPPCWRGITPGVTTPDEAYSIIVRMEGVEFAAMTERLSGEEVRQLTWLFTSPLPDSTGRIYYDNGVVAAILIGTYGSVGLGELIALWGEPESVWTHCFRRVEGSRAETVVLWPNEGYAAAIDHHALPCPVPEGIPLSGHNRVRLVAYFEPSSFPELLEARSLFGADSEDALQNAEPWPSALYNP